MYNEIINRLKNCLDDEWANDIRFATLVFVKNMIIYLQPIMDREDYITVYPELLKRLDDA